MSRPARKSRPRAGRASPARTCSSSTRSISRPMWAPRSKTWTASQSGCAASGHSSSPTCAPARVSTRLRALSSRRAGWTRCNQRTVIPGPSAARSPESITTAAANPAPIVTMDSGLAASRRPGMTKNLSPSRLLLRRREVPVALHGRAHQEAVAFLDDALDIALFDVGMADHDIVPLAGVDDALHPLQHGLVLVLPWIAQFL